MSQRAGALAARGTGIGVEVMGHREGEAPPADAPVAAATPSARVWSRTAPLDTYWRRGSFTALTRGAGHGSGAPSTSEAAHAVAGLPPRFADEPDADGALEDGRDAAGDEGDDFVAWPAPLDAVPAPATSPRVPLADLPRGRAAGNAVHELFERAVPSRVPAGLLAALVPEALQRQGLDPLRWSALLNGAIERAFDVPLVGLGASRPDAEPRTWPTLRTLATGRCFPELAFDFAVATGGDAVTSRDHVVRARHIARVFREHPGGAVPASYADTVAALDFVPLRGLLTGAIDLVVRHDGRWYLLDYKSNHLGDTVVHYAPAPLTLAMTAHHYVLQYHIYLVALHRFLRARQPDYDYDRHVGGIGYLFVRGLDADHAGAGVFADRPPRARIEALDAALRAGAPR
jgi:exodeoxyribonuclease V beta subunit